MSEIDNLPIQLLDVRDVRFLRRLQPIDLSLLLVDRRLLSLCLDAQLFDRRLLSRCLDAQRNDFLPQWLDQRLGRAGELLRGRGIVRPVLRPRPA